MVSSTVQKMPHTVEAYKKLAKNDMEVIEELLREVEVQKKEIGQLKAKNNQLLQKIKSGRIKNIV